MTDAHARTAALVLTLAASLLAWPAAAEEDPDEGVTAASPIEISGFIDTSIFVPIEGTGEDGKVVLSLDQIEIDVIATPAPGLTLRTDLNFFPSFANTGRHLAIEDHLIEQAFIRYHVNGGHDGFFIIAGKMNAPVGVEAIDPPDMYQFSHGQLFEFATPSNLTGFFTGYDTGTITVMAWLTNDWDAPPAPDQYLVGGRVEWAGSGGTVGLSSTFGPMGAEQLYQLMVDLDVIWGFGDLTLLLEGNFGLFEVDDLTSVGGLLALNYAFADELSATLRYDYLNREYDVVREAHSVTGALLFPIADHFGGVLELRADIPAEGDPAVVGALELLATF